MFHKFQVFIFLLPFLQYTHPHVIYHPQVSLGSSCCSLLLGRSGLLGLPYALLLAVLLDDGVASLRQGFRALDRLAEQHSVVDDLLLQLLELGADDAVALRTGQTQLEPVEVGQIATLLWGTREMGRIS